MASFKRTRSLSETTGSATGGDKAPRIDQIVELFQPKPKKFYQIRLVGPMFSYAAHWFEINKKDGKGQAKFSKDCLAWNDEVEALDSDRSCPYCDLDPKRAQVHYYQNVIIRDLEEKAPKDNSVSKAERKTGFKDKDSDSWTPVRVLRLPPSAVQLLRDLAELNKHGKKGEKTAHPVEDEQYGCDIMYKFDPDATGSGKHQFQKGDHSPITEEEAEYLLWNIENMVEPDDVKTAKDEAKRIKPRLVGAEEEDSDDEDGEDDDYPKKDKKSKGKSKPNFEDDDDDEDTPKSKSKGKKSSNDDDDDEDEPPKKSKGKSKSNDDDDDDDDDEPKSKSKGKRYVPEVGDKVKVTDEDDEVVEGKVTNVKGDLVSVKDSDGETHRFNMKDDTIEPLKGGKKSSKDDEDDDDDDEPPKKSKGKSKSNDDDDDEDEDDEPKSKSKGKKSSNDDDDDDDDDDDEPKSKSKLKGKKSSNDDDDDDDDAPPKKSKSKSKSDDDDDDDDEPKSKSKSSKKSSKFDDDDDEDD